MMVVSICFLVFFILHHLNHVGVNNDATLPYIQVACKITFATAYLNQGMGKKLTTIPNLRPGLLLANEAGIKYIRPSRTSERT